MDHTDVILGSDVDTTGATTKDSRSDAVTTQKINILTRRLSGLPLTDQFELDIPPLDENTTVELTQLLSLFPEPPSNDIATETAQLSNSGKNTWGSLRGIAEKFNVFGRG